MVQNTNEIICRIRYTRDSKYRHRYDIESDEGITGSVYFPKNYPCIPDRIILEKESK